MTTEYGLVENLRLLLEDADDIQDPQTGEEHEVAAVRSFEEAGLLTNNHGLVVRMKDGSEFQLTVVRSR